MSKKSYFLIAKSCLVAMLISSIIPARQASAAAITGFNPGNIMSDAVMRNYNSMNQSQIQNFLKSKNACNDTNIARANRYIAQGYQYHIVNGRFVCMADEIFNGKTAAQIIYEAAQRYHINPQVLIVLLQKEQGLVTDTWPNHRQYQAATGYGCPSSGCSNKYAGFENQIHYAASLFDTVLSGGWSNYPLGNRYVAYNPNASCGGATINIVNRATSALYRYTPYQPNAAALAAGAGTGDSCSAYGNRNFYYYFTTWFGSTQTTTTATLASVSSTPASTSQVRYTSNILVADGDYLITTPSGLALDVYGASTANGGNVQIWTRNGTVAQTWNIKRNSDGTYTIKNPNANKVLDVNSAAFTNGTNIQIWDGNNTCAQKWAIRFANNRYTFINACSGHALDVSGGQISTSGTNVWLYQSNGTPAQTFNLLSLKRASVANGKYRISTPGNLSLYVSGSNAKIWNSSNANTQIWQFIREPDGTYIIKNQATGQALDVAGASTVAGANVQVYPLNYTCAQKWIVTRSNGTAAIKSSCSGLALDVSNGAVNTRGTNVQVWSDNKTAAQKWTLTKH